MPNMTLAIPEDLKEKMEQHQEINWSEVARQAIREKMILLEGMDRMLSKSELTVADVEQAAYKVKKKVFKKYRRKFGTGR